jgi:hypothetical protein
MSVLLFSLSLRERVGVREPGGKISRITPFPHG